MNPVRDPKKPTKLNNKAQPKKARVSNGMKTYSAKPSEVKRSWYVIDASSTTLGRLSTVIAGYLTGKNKPMYTPHVDAGDFVVVINSDKLKVTGNKKDAKTYRSYSGYPGNLKEVSLKTALDKDSTKVVYDAVKGMLAENKLRAGRLKRLKIYTGSEHNHTAQNPQAINAKGTK